MKEEGSMPHTKVQRKRRTKTVEGMENEHQGREEDSNKSNPMHDLIKAMMDPYWSWRFMRENGD